MSDIVSKNLILELVRLKPKIGKVGVQKCVYLIQEALGLDLGYEFHMHHYGPYSSELDDTLTEMEAEGLLKVMHVIYPAGYIGHEITIGDLNKEFKITGENEKIVEKVTKFFENASAEQMELSATIHFVHAILEREKSKPVKGRVIAEVQSLKPKFSAETVSNAYDKLQYSGFLLAG